MGQRVPRRGQIASAGWALWHPRRQEVDCTCAKVGERPTCDRRSHRDGATLMAGAQGPSRSERTRRSRRRVVGVVTALAAAVLGATSCVAAGGADGGSSRSNRSAAARARWRRREHAACAQAHTRRPSQESGGGQRQQWRSALRQSALETERLVNFACLRQIWQGGRARAERGAGGPNLQGGGEAGGRGVRRLRGAQGVTSGARHRRRGGGCECEARWAGGVNAVGRGQAARRRRV